MKKRLRTGFTTGTAAAAAAKAGVLHILEKRAPERVLIELMTGERISIAVHACRLIDPATAECRVIKDAGDDPDVTHGAEIGALVRLSAAVDGVDPSPVLITGGRGVGRVTKPGLEVPPGEPAINPGPRRMITAAVTEVLAAHGHTSRAQIEVFVPAGEEIALKTLNARLGILGGISILGTTGIVRPMSHEAFTATIEAGLSVARACGLNRVVLTTGRRSERFAQRLWPEQAEEGFVQVGDFFQKSLGLAAQKGFTQVTLAVFFGKALKMAQGAPHTHAAQSELSLDALAQWAAEATGEPVLAGRIRACNTAREAFGFLAPAHPALLAEVGRRIVAAAARFAGQAVKIQSVIFDYEGGVAFDSEKQYYVLRVTC